MCLKKKRRQTSSSSTDLSSACTPHSLFLHTVSSLERHDVVPFWNIAAQFNWVWLSEGYWWGKPHDLLRQIYILLTRRHMLHIVYCPKQEPWMFWKHVMKTNWSWIPFFFSLFFFKILIVFLQNKDSGLFVCFARKLRTLKGFVTYDLLNFFIPHAHLRCRCCFSNAVVTP